MHLSSHPRSHLSVFRFPPYTLALATELTRIVREVGLQLLHVHYPFLTRVGGLANLMLEDLGLPRVPVVHHHHGTDTELVGQEPAFKAAGEFSLNRCDAGTAVSENLTRTTLETFQCRRPIEVIYNFVDTQVFHPPERNEFPRNGEQWQVVHISNFRPVKRVMDIVLAFNAIAQCFPCHLTLAGDGPERALAQETVCSLGLSEKVSFPGKLLEVEDLLAQSDLLMCVSENESFGMSIAEAMATGLPGIASRAGGIPEVVEDGETGILVNVGDVDGMAEALLGLMTQPEGAKQMGEAGRRRIEERFSPQVSIPKYEALYRALTDGAVGGKGAEE